MSANKNHFLLLVSCFLFMTAGCGFAPMYGTTTTGAYGQAATEDSLSQIAIDTIPDAQGQALRNLLIDRFYRHGRPADTRYTLKISPLKEQQQDLDVTIESETTRAQLRLDTAFQMVSNETGQVVLSRQLRAFNSFNVLGSQFTTIVSEEDAREAAIADLARQIETQVSLYLNRK